MATPVRLPAPVPFWFWEITAESLLNWVVSKVMTIGVGVVPLFQSSCPAPAPAGMVAVVSIGGTRVELVNLPSGEKVRGAAKVPLITVPEPSSFSALQEAFQVLLAVLVK